MIITIYRYKLTVFKYENQSLGDVVLILRFNTEILKLCVLGGGLRVYFASERGWSPLGGMGSYAYGFYV